MQTQEDKDFIEKVRSLSFVVKNKERLPYGEGSRGQYIPAEDGRRAIFVPSFGTMEKAEVDYVVEVAKEQEDDRIKRGGISLQKAMLEEAATQIKAAKPGQRRKVADEILKGG